MIRLHPDWPIILTRAWSMRFILLGFGFQGASLFLQMIQPYAKGSPFVLSMLAALCLVAAGISRVVFQASLSGGTNGRTP
jgi:hypothetical protein